MKIKYSNLTQRNKNYTKSQNNTTNSDYTMLPQILILIQMEYNEIKYYNKQLENAEW